MVQFDDTASGDGSDRDPFSIDFDIERLNKNFGHNRNEKFPELDRAGAESSLQALLRRMEEEAAERKRRIDEQLAAMETRRQRHFDDLDRGTDPINVIESKKLGDSIFPHEIILKEIYSVDLPDKKVTAGSRHESEFLSVGQTEKEQAARQREQEMQLVGIELDRMRASEDPRISNWVDSERVTGLLRFSFDPQIIWSIIRDRKLLVERIDQAKASENPEVSQWAIDNEARLLDPPNTVVGLSALDEVSDKLGYPKFADFGRVGLPKANVPETPFAGEIRRRANDTFIIQSLDNNSFRKGGGIGGR